MSHTTESSSPLLAGHEAPTDDPSAGDHVARGLRPWGRSGGPWVYVVDTLLAALSFALTIAIWANHRATLPDLSADTRTFLLTVAVVANFALVLRRRFPVQVHLLVVLCSAATTFGPLQQAIFAMVISLYSLGRYAPDVRISVLGMLLAVLVVTVDVYGLGNGQFGVTQLLLIAAFWYAGRRVRFRGEHLRLLEERARYLEQRRHSEAVQAVAEERSRIARELHDIVAHQLSLMTVQAGAAKTVATSDPQAALHAMEAVEHAGRQALQEMRHLLHVLRRDDDGGELLPQPGCADLDALAGEVRAAGVDVELLTSGDLTELPARVDLTTYRVIQEALTNVLKHAGDNANVTITVVRGADGVELGITDSGQGAGDTPGRGYGIAGMRERTALLGGWLKAAERSEGGFEVRAFLPLEGLSE